MVTVIYCLPDLLSRDHQLLLNLAQVPSIAFLNTHSSLSWFKMNGTPPSLEEKVRHCGEEQEYRGSPLTAIRVTENHSMIGVMMTSARKKGVVKIGMTSGDIMVGG